MYKVFVNDKPIIITSSLEKIVNFSNYAFNHIVIEEVIYKLRNENIKGIILYTENLEQDWVFFLKNFKVIPAAGGLVVNLKKDILFIYRHTTWDLPKGRIEKDERIEETAIREVEEECGITHLKIDKFLLTTYHLFYQEGHKIKETHWFLMNTTYDGKLTPQLEEGITKVAFKSKNIIGNILKNSYANIQLVYDEYIGKFPHNNF
ncbi:MAG: NUDIX hydrolase [Polaribacter sp.]